MSLISACNEKKIQPSNHLKKGLSQWLKHPILFLLSMGGTFDTTEIVLLVKFSQKLQNCFPTDRRKHLSNVVNAVILTERKSELWVSSFQMCYRQTEFPTLLTLCFNYVFGYWQMEIMLQFVLILKLCYWQTEIVLPTY